MNTAPGAGHPVTDPVGVGASPTHSQRPTGACFSFTIKAPPSQNEQKKWSRWEAKRRRDELVFEMRQAINAAGCMPSSHDRLKLFMNPWKRVVKFTRYTGGKVKVMDKGNFIGGLKACLDELKLTTWKTTEHGQKYERQGFGFLFDDSPSWVCDMYDQQEDKSRAGQLLIEIQ